MCVCMCVFIYACAFACVCVCQSVCGRGIHSPAHHFDTQSSIHPCDESIDPMHAHAWSHPACFCPSNPPHSVPYSIPPHHPFTHAVSRCHSLCPSSAPTVDVAILTHAPSIHTTPQLPPSTSPLSPLPSKCPTPILLLRSLYSLHHKPSSHSHSNASFLPVPTCA
jgi:hypothetical protein